MESVPEAFCLHHATTGKVDHVMGVEFKRIHFKCLVGMTVLLFNIIQCHVEHLLKMDTRLLCARNFPCAVQKVRVLRMHLLHLVKQHELSSSFLIQLKGSDMVQTL